MLCVEPILPFYTLANTLATLVVYATNTLLLHEITAILPNITAWAYASTPQSVLYCRMPLPHSQCYTAVCLYPTVSDILPYASTPQSVLYCRMPLPHSQCYTAV